MRKNAVVFVLFIVGLGILLYPLMSNYVMSKAHTNIISEYEKDVENLSEEERKQLKQAAEQFNEHQVDSNLTFTDPFENTDDNSGAGYYTMLNIGETIGALEIPKIDVNLPIYHGTSAEVLDEGVGHLSNSSLPIGGENTHAILSAHRGLSTAKMFRDLDELVVGDSFYLHVLDEVLAYKVVDISIVLPDETNNLKVEDGKDFVTLVTCDPYMVNTHRLLVKGERVSYVTKDISEKPVVIERPSQITFTFTHKLFVAAIIIITLLLLFLKRNKRERRDEE